MIYPFLSSGLRSEPRSWRAVWCGGVSHPWPILPPWLGATNSPWTILGVDRCDEVAGNDPGALVDQLVEGVLSVCPGLAPHDRTGGVVDLRFMFNLTICLNVVREAFKTYVLSGFFPLRYSACDTFSPALVTYFPLLSMSPCWK